MSNDFDNPKAWLENIEKGTVNTPHTHPDDPTPFVWKKTADEILASVNRARATLNRVVAKSTTDH